jgi:hypothetical protein
MSAAERTSVTNHDGDRQPSEPRPVERNGLRVPDQWLHRKSHALCALRHVGNVAGRPLSLNFR